MPDLTPKHDYQSLVHSIHTLLHDGRNKAINSVNTILLQTYREIGRSIVEYEQWWQERALYGSELLKNLAKELKKYGKGFSRSNLTYMRLLYLTYPKSETLSHILSWSHYFELLKLENTLARQFYEQQCIQDKRSVRELKRQKNSMLFERLALGKSEDEIKELSISGQSLGWISNQLFVSKYQLYLPDKQELTHHIDRIIDKHQW